MPDAPRSRTPNPCLAAGTLLISIFGLHRLPAGQLVLSIVSDPPQASVFLDGRFVGASPVKTPAINEGSHFLKLTRHGYGNWSQVIKVAGKAQTVNVKLTAQPRGMLRIDSQPANADAFVDGQFRGRTPLLVRGLPTGSVSVRIEKNELLPWQGAAEVPAGKPGALTVTLQSKVEAYLLEGIKSHPEVVKNYTELGHFYITRHDFDKAFKYYAQGMDATLGAGAIPNDCLRLYNELRYCYQGTIVKLGDEETMGVLRTRFEELYEDGIKRTPTNERNYWALAAIKQQKGEWDECIRLHEQALKHARNERERYRSMRATAKATYQQASALQKEKKLTEALAIYESAGKKYAPAHSALTSLSSAISLCDSSLKNPAKAQELRRFCVKLAPDAAASRTYQKAIAQRLAAEQKHKEAIAEYEGFLKLYADDSSCPAVCIAIASICATKLNNPQKAIEWYQRCAEKYPAFDGCAGALSAAAELYEKMKRPLLAAAFRALLIRRYPRSGEAAALDDDAETKSRREQAAKLYATAQGLEAKELEKAIGTYEQIVARFGKTSHAVSAQERVVYLHQVRTKDFAKEAAARVLQVERFPDHDSAPAWLTTLAGRHTAQGQHEKAVETYRRVAAEYPGSDQAPEAQYNLATIYCQTIFDQAKAVAEYRELVTRWPNHPRAPASMYQIGWSYYLSQRGTRKEAKAAFRELLTRYPHSSYADTVEYWYDAVRITAPDVGK